MAEAMIAQLDGQPSRIRTFLSQFLDVPWPAGDLFEDLFVRPVAAEKASAGRCFTSWPGSRYTDCGRLEWSVLDLE